MNDEPKAENQILMLLRALEKTPTSAALAHFDDFYSSVYKSRWDRVISKSEVDKVLIKVGEYEVGTFVSRQTLRTGQ